MGKKLSSKFLYHKVEFGENEKYEACKRMWAQWTSIKIKISSEYKINLSISGNKE